MSGRLLFLGYDRDTTRLYDVIEADGWAVEHRSSPVDDLTTYDLVVSFGYRQKISSEVLAGASRPVLNLHMSYLPFNRGAHPNFWSFYDGTPAGISIHELDDTIDGGPVCFQKLVNFDNEEQTFATTYDRLFAELEELFCVHAEALLSGEYEARPQRGKGTSHCAADLPGEMTDWHLDIQQTLAKIDQSYGDRHKRDMELVDEIQAVRTRNNVNWMDLLRIALTHAPDEAKAVLRTINSDDRTISELFKELGK